MVSIEDADWREAAREEVLQISDDLLYTEKTHLHAAERLQKVHQQLGLAMTVLATAAAATIVGDWNKIAAGLLALAAAILSGILTFMKPEKSAEQHLGAGRQLGALRVRARQFLQLDLMRLSVSESREVIASIVNDKATIDAASPGTSGGSFEAARRRIQSGVYDRDSEPRTLPSSGRRDG
ncbi:MAG TPA: SLATT domain-containing protein [Kribbella sp.]|jgi:hypothetical protein